MSWVVGEAASGRRESSLSFCVWELESAGRVSLAAVFQKEGDFMLDSASGREDAGFAEMWAA